MHRALSPCMISKIVFSSLARAGEVGAPVFPSTETTLSFASLAALPASEVAKYFSVPAAAARGGK